MKIRLYGRLKEFVDGKDVIEIKIVSDVEVMEIIRRLKIPENYVSFVEKDGKRIEMESRVNNQDKITILPILSGG